MPTLDEITENLEMILIPNTMRNLAQMNLIRDIAVNAHEVTVDLASAALNDSVQKWISNKIKESLLAVPGVKDVNINYTESTPAEINRIGNVIAVMSGKGGVGKSLVSGLTAIALNRQGYEVGILDADITGPSIPRMFGITDRPGGSDKGILPVTSKTGIEIMSINLLLSNEDEAVIWRGPLIAKTISQFWGDVLWGKLDYLIVDLPPGTADAPLTVMQSLSVSGVIIVFTPQDLTAMIVRKAVNMTRQMEKQVLGIVENMSYLYVPELKKKIELFGKSKGEEMAKTTGAPLLGQLPIDPELAKLCDEGDIERYSNDIYNEFIDNLIKAIPHPDKKLNEK